MIFFSTGQPGEIIISVLQQRVAALEQERAEFVKRKQQLESEFNQKRAKFKELYLSKEEELKCQAASLEGAQSELSRVQAQLEQAQADMENIKAVATVSESTKQEAIDQVKGQWQEEVASLQAIMKDTVREYEVQFHQRLEQERAQWNQYREVVEREMGELRHRLSEGGQEEENLENDMKKAQEDAEKLRSVVMPMEQEIAALKVKLTVAEDRVKELEASKVKELNHVLEAEKSCRTDLEMYVAVLNTQKSVLQEDAEKLRKELHEVCHLLELERQQHNQLKHTWQRANDQFLESQRLLMRDMQRIENVLTSEQLRQVEEIKKRDQEDEKERITHGLTERSLKCYSSTSDHYNHSIPPSYLLQPHSAHGSMHSLDSDLVAGGPMDLYKDGLRRVQSTDSLGSSPGLQGLGGYNHKAKSASHLDESDFGPLVGADCGAPEGLAGFGDTLSVSSIQLTAGHFLLTKDQEKAIKAMTPEQEETASLMSSISHAHDTTFLTPSGYRLVSDQEWNLLQQEVKNAGRKLGRRCDMCSNYEKQLQVIQGQEAETRDQVKKLQVMLRQANDQLERTMSEKQELEDSVKQGNEETTVAALMHRVQESESLLKTLQEAFSQAKRNTQEQMAVLMQSREQVAEELSRLQRDNDSLTGKHRLHLSLQQQEDFKLPTMELQSLVLQLREDIVVVRTAADHLEEKLKAEILFLKEQLQAEQCLKENLEDTLQLEIDGCKEEIVVDNNCDVLISQLESSLAEKRKTLVSVQGLKSSLEEQLRELTTTKTALEAQALDEKDKALRLQTELDVSEQVQRDFVKLSQTLQVQLERIRQADSLDRIRAILNNTNLTDISQLPET
uniref:Rabaptin, RAB GTPase binding effector protein 1 n=1 Tax=Oncorhynchus tshawytscha TaxID=74940 RepID=A0AAZ3Q5W5_ONCTS